MATTDVALRVDQLGKMYFIGAQQQRQDRLGKHLVSLLTTPLRRAGKLLRGQATGASELDEQIWALKNTSFEVKRGEVIGLIGHNGAGKSTLLKILSGITQPTEGYADVYGRVGSLLEVGTGFHPELTGRDNVFLNGAILGMKKAEIARKFDEIVEFAGCERFIDTPVKHYSSGMRVRLAFAVAAHLEPEILLVDEVLTVGDASFQKKSLNKMDEVSRSGRTVILVSHNMAAIHNLCTRAIILRQGGVAFDGTADEAVRQYLQHLSDGVEDAFRDNPERTSEGPAQLTAAQLLDDEGRPTQFLVAGRTAFFRFEYDNPTKVSRFNIGFIIYNHLGTAITAIYTTLNSDVMQEVGHRGEVVCEVPNLPLPLGQYRVAAALNIGKQQSDMIPNALTFEVKSSVFYESGKTPNVSVCCMMAHDWSHKITEPIDHPRMGNH